MTNSEAIKIINQYDCNFYWTDGEKIPTEDLIEAFDLAVKALKEQEPKVLTLEEVLSQEWDYVYIETEHRPYSKEIEAYCGTHTIYCSTTVVHKRQTSGDSKYGKTWRCWTARPTDEQREAVPWNT